MYIGQHCLFGKYVKYYTNPHYLYQPSLFIYINKMFSVTSSLLSPVFNYGEGIQSRRMSSPGVVYLQQVALLVEAQVARGEVPALRK